MATPRTTSQKIWDNHLVRSEAGKPDLLYIDLHLVHEVTSPQAFESLRLAGRKVRRPELTLATVDHNVPTADRDKPWTDPLSVQQVETLRTNVAEFGVPYFGVGDVRQGIVHVIGPEQGLTQPGMTIVCGDSHTATHGALGALAFGTKSIAPVAKIVGPGNAYVAAAKRLVRDRVEIDNDAGPSEVVVLADETARPDKKNVEVYRELQALQDEASLALRGVFAKHRQFVLRN